MPDRARPRRIALAACVAALIAPAGAQAACPDEGLVPVRAADLPEYERSILCLVNAERAERGRRALKPHRRLALAAARHAGDMVERRYFAHESLGGTGPLDRLRRAGYGSGRRDWMFGEILAWGTLGRSRPSSVVRAWMASAGHRAAILEPGFDEAGAGAVTGNPRRPVEAGVTVAVEFGHVQGG